MLMAICQCLDVSDELVFNVVLLLLFSHGVWVDGDGVSSGNAGDSAMPPQHSLSTGLHALLSDVPLLELLFCHLLFTSFFIHDYLITRDVAKVL